MRQIRADYRFEEYPEEFQHSGYIMRIPAKLEYRTQSVNTRYNQPQREKPISLF